MKTYKHLNKEERDQLAVMMGRGLTLRAIGVRMGRSAGSLCRELARHRPLRGCQDYLPHKAQERAEESRRQSHKRMRLKSRVLRFEVEKSLMRGDSPELIAGQFRRFRPELPSTSPEAIYQWIYAEAPHLVGCLIRSRAKRRCRRSSRKTRGTKILHRVRIGERPAEINNRREAGHWESDLIVGPGRSALQTTLERISRRIQLCRVPNKSAAAARQGLEKALGPLPIHLRRSITYDNGSENAEHHLLNQTLGTRSFFCEPYHSWEKGSVENRNGWVRRFFPKRTNFDTIPEAAIQQAQDWINNRPMKCLGFKTPNDVFASLVALAP